MRKSISLVLVAIMMLSAIVFAMPTSVSAATGSNPDIEYIEAPYFETAPTIDGYISEAEWGEASFTVEASDCATKDDTDPYARFLYWRVGTREDFVTWEYTVWLRWDTNYFYIGVKNKDVDGHALKNGTSDTWDGDALQLRVDSEGPNAAVRGGQFAVTADMKKPWSNSEKVPDFLFGYVEIAGGFTEAWENTTNKGMTSFSKNPMGTANVVVAPAGSTYSSDTQNNITTYEVAIPWAYILNDTDRAEFTTLTYTVFNPSKRNGNRQGGIGREFGMSMVVLDDGTNPDAKWDAFMAWGSGICGAQYEEGALSCTGSNSVLLVEDKINPSGYTKYDPSSLLDAKFSSTNIDDPNTYYDYLAGDTKSDGATPYDQLSVLKYDDPADLTIWGAPEYQGKISNIGGEHGNVLDYRDPSLGQNYIDTRDEENRFYVPTSFTFEFDICYTGNEMFPGTNYASALYNWFGGAHGYSYRCGYFFNDSEFQIVNEIGADSNNPDILARYPYDLKKDNWYKWRFQFDNESCTARLWVDDLSTTADNKDVTEDGEIKSTEAWGTMIFNYKWRYFYYSSDDGDGTLLLFRQMNTQTMYDNIKIYNFASTQKINDASEQPGNNTYVPKDETHTGDVDTNASYLKDGKWYIPVKVISKYLDANEITFTINVDSSLATFDSLKGISADAYKVEDKGNGEYLITITDLTVLKNMKAGDVFFEIVLVALDENAAIGDVIKVTDYYRIPASATGDSMMLVAVAAVAAGLGCVAVVVVRRKKYDEIAE